MRQITSQIIVAVTLLGAASGCGGRYLPNWFSPGPSDYQRLKAQRYDPYPDNVAAPELRDARPREFLSPPPEANRARWRQSGALKYGEFE